MRAQVRWVGLPLLAALVSLGVVTAPPATAGEGQASHVIWTQVLSDDFSTARIVAADPGGRHVRAVSHPAADEFDIDAEVSPNGKWVVFERDRLDGTVASVIAGIDGKHERVLDLGCVDPCALISAPSWARTAVTSSSPPSSGRSTRSTAPPVPVSSTRRAWTAATGTGCRPWASTGRTRTTGRVLTRRKVAELRPDPQQRRHGSDLRHAGGRHARAPGHPVVAARRRGRLLTCRARTDGRPDRLRDVRPGSAAPASSRTSPRCRTTATRSRPARRRSATSPTTAPGPGRASTPRGRRVDDGSPSATRSSARPPSRQASGPSVRRQPPAAGVAPGALRVPTRLGVTLAPVLVRGRPSGRTRRAG